MSEERRLERLVTLDEQIERSIQGSLENGELKLSKDWGRKLDLGDGYDETPEELRMAFKALKDSGFVPPEIQMLKDLAAARATLASLDPAGSEAAALKRQIAENEISVRLRLENLRS
ncbi:hypothetical protein BH10PSE17_BH10PSE17_33500 [soil metagenome]